MHVWADIYILTRLVILFPSAGVVQTAYANGGSTHFLEKILVCDAIISLQYLWLCLLHNTVNMIACLARYCWYSFLCWERPYLYYFHRLLYVTLAVPFLSSAM